MTEQRTDLIEREVASLFEVPLTAETVFLRPTRRDRQKDKEVCDVLLALRRDAVVLSLKSQQDPTTRRGSRLERWCAKAAREASMELHGAMRALESQAIWCVHRRRGRVDISAGSLNVLHGVALVETLQEVRLPEDLPAKTARGAPLTYLSTNDLLNLVTELRAFPDLAGYLDARLTLPLEVRGYLGRESLLFTYYLLNGEDFGGVREIDDIREAVRSRRGEMHERLAEKHRLDQYAMVVEHVSNELAMRLPDWAAGLDPSTVDLFKLDGHVRLQEELCDLRLGARRAVGRALVEVRQRVLGSGESKGVGFITVHDAKPEFLYVVASCRGVSRQDMIDAALKLLRTALAYRGKPRGMVIMDRDGDGYEVGYAEMDEPSDEVAEVGRRVFGHLRQQLFDLSTLPPGDARSDRWVMSQLDGRAIDRPSN